MKRILYFFLTFLIISTWLFPNYIQAETNADIQQKIDSAKQERSKLLEQEQDLQSALLQLSKEGQSLQTNVKTLDTTRNKLANDLNLTKNKINSSNLTIQKLENDIDQNETEVEVHLNAIKDSLKQLASYDKHSPILDLLVYRSLGEMWTDTTNLWDVQDQLGNRINKLEKSKIELIQNKVAKETQKVTLVSLSSQLTGQKKVADETRKAQALLLSATKNKETEYQKMLADNRARQAEFEKQLFLFESQLQASDVSLRPVAGRGALSWPLSSVYITQLFGRTSSSIRLYSSGTHNGIDFRASVGTPVKSVRAGVVSGVGNTDDQFGCYSYGRWILIRHSNGVSSLYAHLSGSIVALGEDVTDGQTIGYSGGQPGQSGSGFSTGPHLHLGLFATAGVKILPFSTSKNCKNTSVPLANPQDYLDPMAYLPVI
ncbi:MAG: peptidoglycan DD-metalloendopeptidase family protein [Patescibacteria group bacterium]